MAETKGSSRGRKPNLIIQTWNRCKSLARTGEESARLERSLSPKSKSWPSSMVASPIDDDRTTGAKPRKRRVAPEGCFSVYVGPERQRFVVKTEYANHPLFKRLLEEAESEYGYNPEGPLALPCNVDVFYRVLVEMDENNHGISRRGCVGRFPKNNHGFYQLLSPSRLIAMNQF